MNEFFIIKLNGLDFTELKKPIREYQELRGLNIKFELVNDSIRKGLSRYNKRA